MLFYTSSGGRCVVISEIDLLDAQAPDDSTAGFQRHPSPSRDWDMYSCHQLLYESPLIRIPSK